MRTEFITGETNAQVKGVWGISLTLNGCSKQGDGALSLWGSWSLSWWTALTLS